MDAYAAPGSQQIAEAGRTVADAVDDDMRSCFDLDILAPALPAR